MPVQPPQAFRGLTPRVGEPGAHVLRNLREAPGQFPERGNGKGPEASKFWGHISTPGPSIARLALLRYLTRERHPGSCEKTPTHPHLGYIATLAHVTVSRTEGDLGLSSPRRRVGDKRTRSSRCALSCPRSIAWSR